MTDPETKRQTLREELLHGPMFKNPVRHLAIWHQPIDMVLYRYVSLCAFYHPTVYSTSISNWIPPSIVNFVLILVILTCFVLYCIFKSVNKWFIIAFNAFAMCFVCIKFFLLHWKYIYVDNKIELYLVIWMRFARAM